MKFAGRLFAIYCAIGVCAQAADVQLTFEGLKNQEQIANFYNGGAGGGQYDETGTRYATGGSTGGGKFGITFGGNSIAVVAEDAGGTGRFANNPSGTTVLSFNNAIGSNSFMNVTAGFAGGVAFWYSQPFYPTNITVYEGLNATGRVLAVLNMAQSASNCPLDKAKNSLANCWAAVGIAFTGIAHSVDFSGANFTAFDNLTLGSSVTVPFPPTNPPVVSCPILSGVKSFILEHKIDATSFTSSFIPSFSAAQLAVFFDPTKEIHTHFEYSNTDNIVRAWSIALPLGAPAITPPGYDFQGNAIATAVIQVDKIYTTCVPRPAIMVVGPVLDSTAVYGSLVGLPHGISFSFDPTKTSNVDNASNVATVDSGTTAIIGPVGSVIVVPKLHK